MATGKVKWFNVTKGFGFITSEDGTDLFVHHADVKGSSIGEGDSVTFEQTQGPKGPKAVNVQKA